MKLLLVTAALLAIAAPSVAEIDAMQHRAEVDEWHQGRLERLQKPESWLSLVGLFRLSDGDNSFGSDESNDLRFPAKAPAHAGSIHIEGGKAKLLASATSGILIDGIAATEQKLGSDVDEDTSIMEMGSFRFYVLERDELRLLRVKDRESDILAGFHGIDRFDVDLNWRVQARWVDEATPRMLRIPNVLGQVSEEELAGHVEFEVEGVTYRLDPVVSGDSLWFIYGDATNGDESYGAGRFLYTDLPDEDGNLVIDFNRSYNPPCVFTPYATCPLPPEGNTLALRVTAGEKMWGEEH